MEELKDIFLLGAGASADAGAPVNRNFLNDEYLDKEIKIKDYLSPEDFVRFDKIKYIAKNIFPNPQDIELFLNGTISATFIGVLPDKFEKLWGFNHELSKEIEWFLLTIIHLSLNDNLNLQIYTKFYEKLDKNTDSIISFNYDLIPDCSLLKEKGELNYHFLEHEVTFPEKKFNIYSGISLLKLHGSLNWLMCSNSTCDNISIYQDDVAYKAEEQGINFNCDVCGHSLLRFIIPPRWDKNDMYSSILQRLWKVAYTKLLEANNLYIIGYSLPDSDIYARYLLSFVLTYNKSLNLIIVDKNKEIEPRYKQFLRQINISSNRCTILPYSFKDYIHNSL